MMGVVMKMLVMESLKLCPQQKWLHVVCCQVSWAYAGSSVRDIHPNFIPFPAVSSPLACLAGQQLAKAMTKSHNL